MKKGILKCVLVLLSVLIAQSAFASEPVLSSQYDSITTCNSDVTKYNLEFPDYVRSSCFLNEGKYYYSLCSKGTTCNSQSQTTTTSTTNTTSTSTTTSNTPLYKEGGTNTYGENIKASVKTKLDAIITALENKRKSTPVVEFGIYMNTFLGKLSTLESKYNSNAKIKEIVVYLKYEVERMIFETTAQKEENDVDTFMCELMGTCGTQGASTGTTNVTTANITLSITINQGIFYCGDPNRNDYTTFSPINKIVLLNNDIITSCTTKGGKAWTKSATGTIENLKNISDVKNGDVFTTGSTSTTTNTNNNTTTSSTTGTCITTTINGYTLPVGTNGLVRVYSKVVSGTNYQQEFKCDGNGWYARGTETSTSTTTATSTDGCGAGKKQIGAVCVTDTASVNPGGNYTLGKGACVSHIGTDVGYDGNSYTKAINGQTHGIGKTLNKCIESCDIGDINIGVNKASCFYEGKVIRSAGSSTITNITSGTIINTGTTTTTNNLTNEKFYVSAANTSTGTLVNFKIDKEYGYKVCVMTAGPDTDMFSILADGTTMSRSGNSTGLGSKLKADGTFEGTLYYGPTAGDLYLNLYCSTIVGARYSDLTKIIPSTKISNIITAPIITRTISNMPSDQITSTSTSTSTSTTGTCIATTINGYTLPAGTNGLVRVYSKVVSGTNYQQEFKCDGNGWYARGTETSTSATTNTSTSASKLLLTVDKSSANVGETVTLSYDIGTNYSVCTAHISYGTGYATLGASNQLYNKYNGPTELTGTRSISITNNNVQDGKVTLYFSCYNTVTAINEAKNIIINVITPAPVSNPAATTTAPTYTQEQVNAAVGEIISVHGTGVEAIKVLVAGILKLEAAGAVGLRPQVAIYLGKTLDQVNAAINEYK